MSESESQPAASKRKRRWYLFTLPVLLTIAQLGIVAFGWVHGWHFVQGPQLQSNGGKDSREPGLAKQDRLIQWQRLLAYVGEDRSTLFATISHD